MTDHRIHRCEHLDATAIAHLVEESRAEGFRHLTRLVTDYETGSNRFDQPGEALFIATHGDRVVGICGLNRDPHESGRIGRVRRLYVSQAYRRQGIARLLMAHVIEEARGHFERLVLRTDNPVADRFYRSLGFSAKASDEQVTHQLWLRSGG